MSYMPLMHRPPLIMLAGSPKSLLQSVTRVTPHKLAPGGMAADVETVRIAAETRGVFVDPCNAAADLVRHHAKVAVCCLNRDEIEHDVMGASIDRTARPGKRSSSASPPSQAPP